jgi:spore germination cell wall hydrolase CwlJ-like protein
MAPVRTMRASRARAELAILRTIAGVVLAVLGYAGLTTGAVGPAFGSVTDITGARTASLARAGDELIITGSIDHIFSTGSFSGTNKAKKRDRLRPVVDVHEFMSRFDDVRAKMRALRDPRGAPLFPEPASEPAEDVMVASLEADVTSDALGAIDAAAEAPVFGTQSDLLAYARADVPATVFDGTIKDKNGKKVSEKEFQCMATAIYFEARGESYRGQVAVGQVVMNRVAHKLYPDTICSVVFQNQHRRNACQFSFACDGIPERITEAKAWEQAEEIARGVISGDLYLTEVGYATHYHATYVYPHWAPRMKKVTKIGLHVFYHFKRGWKFG